MKLLESNSIPRLAQLDLRRRRLGMSRPVLARRSGVSIARVHEILGGHVRNPRLATIHALARALGVCVSVGSEAGIREAVTADEMRRQRAFDKSERLAGGVQASMGLEAQAVAAAERASLVERLAYKLLAGPNRRLWED
jgi:transcriptional regulator with XRE-family HTH domain